MFKGKSLVALLLGLSITAILITLWSLKGPWLLLQDEKAQVHLNHISDEAFYLSDLKQVVESPINPIPQLGILSPDLQARVDLGRQLFRDVRLSGDNTVSCSSCHIPEIGGHDPRGDSFGITGEKLERNSPTVLNAVFNVKQFWDGRSPDLFDQARHPVENPVEMDGKWPTIIERLQSDSGMVKQFSVYPQGITTGTIIDAISLYERTLVTPNSPFDRYLMGEEGAISEKQKSGYGLFVKFGCISCHQGRNVGGNLFEKVGVYASDEQLEQLFGDDLGRYEVTGDNQDYLVFRVPSLRNVARTAPYFHNGLYATLDDAVRSMGQLQLGRALSEDAIEQIVAFLESLNGDLGGIE